MTLTQADSTTYTYASDRDTGFNTAVEAQAAFGAGVNIDIVDGIGVAVSESAFSLGAHAGIKTSFENSLGWLDSAQTGHGEPSRE